MRYVIFRTSHSVLLDVGDRPPNERRTIICQHCGGLFIYLFALFFLSFGFVSTFRRWLFDEWIYAARDINRCARKRFACRLETLDFTKQHSIIQTARAQRILLYLFPRAFDPSVRMPEMSKRPRPVLKTGVCTRPRPIVSRTNVVTVVQING